MTARATDRLDPASRIGPPRPGTVLRTLLVAALLALAAAALYADPGPRAPQPPPGPPPPPADGPLPLPAGLVGVPIRLAEAAPLAVLRRGDRVDLVALPTEPQPAEPQPAEPPAAEPPAAEALSTEPRPADRAAGGPIVLAAGALVLDAVAGADAPVLYLALTDAQARAVLGAAPTVRFGVVVRAG